MLYCENWETIQKRYEEFWERENHDRPIISIEAPKAKQLPKIESRHTTLKERWIDTEYMLESGNWNIQNTYFGGEAFPLLWPNLGPDFFAGCYGTKLEFGEDTSWAVPFLKDEDIERCEEPELDTSGEYYLKMLEMTEALVQNGKDKYIVGITDIHPGADGLVSMRGPQELCCDTFDNPEFIRRGALDLFDGFTQMYDELYALTTRYQKGSSNWMGIWHPGRWYVTSCDFSCMISSEMFEDFVIPELEKELNFLDASIYHLDGPDALKHLDRLLQLDKLNGIQWVYGAGQPTASYWVGVLQKIQNAGKIICVDVVPGELAFMLENLRPEGVMYHVVDVKSEDDARSLVKMADKYKKRLY